MGIWTISAQAGTPGDEIAAGLAEAAGVMLYDRSAFAELARRLQLGLPALEQLEERFCGWSALALALASGTGAAEPLMELRLKSSLPELGRRLVAEAAREPCVIAAPSAFASLAAHPGAVHARIRAPFDWRLDAHRRGELVDRRRAEKELKHADHLQHAWVRLLVHEDAEDESQYTITLDASRLGADRIVETLLAAGGASRRTTTT